MADFGFIELIEGNSSMVEGLALSSEVYHCSSGS